MSNYLPVRSFRKLYALGQILDFSDFSLAHLSIWDFFSNHFEGFFLIFCFKISRFWCMDLIQYEANYYEDQKWHKRYKSSKIIKKYFWHFHFLKLLCANGTLSSDLVYGSDGLANDYKELTQSRAAANYPLNNMCKHYFCPARVVVKIPLLHISTPLHSGTYW